MNKTEILYNALTGCRTDACYTGKFILVFVIAVISLVCGGVFWLIRRKKELKNDV